MSREELVAMTRSLVEHGAADTMEYADEIVRVPAASYTDPELYEREKRNIFRRLPLMVAPSCELPEPGDYKAMDICGVPLLLTRQRDGSVAAFLNMCTHRGNPVVSGTGNATRFMCGYHGWTFKNDGDLVGVASPKDFGAVDKAALCLKRFPSFESAGLIWATLDLDSKLPIENYLSGYDALLDAFGFKDWTLFSQRTLDGPNWKTAYDGYLDFYHLPVLHKETFGADFFNRANYFFWGPHQRLSSPSKFVQKTGSDEQLDLTQMSDEDLPPDALTQGVWTIFPHISIASFYGGGQRGAMISQLFPGETVGTSTTTQYYVMENQPETDEQVKSAHEQFDFLEVVVRDEDYATGKRQHEALQSGMMKEVLFGKNERGGQVFHQWVDKLTNASDEELLEIFSAEQKQAAE
ncbi:aromatic ring-hydroxylating oxygenase subunit alpha [Erythrobacter rubeus]|uniref:Aromatic ring-hydroxylating dioxygenase subunit alpha n=1 Tax=Erythrobacter rubeus TaxID=2760803 RepID=A0ABR8KVD2_9SPHN|nr:aromatic ring-hydroxylating dioxygenase subunit alpha [Erythrobacter rubeus]MBD2843335.1 aromatic ring-hydroxylating dioxygenase subunit alpha [Erythrobacter rubeus]